MLLKIKPANFRKLPLDNAFYQWAALTSAASAFHNIVPQVSFARLPKYRCLQVAIYHLLFPEQRKRTLNTAFIRKRDLHSEVRKYQKELMDGHI